MYREYRAPGALGREPLPHEYPLLTPPAARDPIVQALRASHGPVLEIPVDMTEWGPLPGRHARAMYRAIFHRRPLLNGYGGYWPNGFIERMELASRLPDPAALAELRRQTGLATVVVNTGSLSPEARFAWRQTILGESPGLHPTGMYDDAVVLEVRND